MKKFLCMFLSLIMMLSLVACNNEKDDIPNRENEIIDDKIVQNVEVENKNDDINNESGETILSGDVIEENIKKYFSEIKLKNFENYQTLILDENPSTGYTWSYKIEDESIAIIEDDNFVAASGDLVGAHGYHHYKLTGLTKGKTEVIFNRMRIWEGESSSIETVTFLVSVDKDNKIAILEETHK